MNLAVMAGLTRHPYLVDRTAWMPGRARHDKAGSAAMPPSVIADLIRNPCRAIHNNREDTP